MTNDNVVKFPRERVSHEYACAMLALADRCVCNEIEAWRRNLAEKAKKESRSS